MISCTAHAQFGGESSFTFILRSTLRPHLNFAVTAVVKSTSNIRTILCADAIPREIFALLGFISPCIVIHSNKSTNHMQRRAINLRDWCIWLIELFEYLRFVYYYYYYCHHHHHHHHPFIIIVFGLSNKYYVTAARLY